MNRRVDRQSAENLAAPEIAGAEPRMRAWLDQHLYSALSSLGRLWSHRGATALTVMVMGLALALPLLLSLLLDNLQGLGGAVSDSREVSAFLSAASTADAAERAASAARALEGVASVAVRDPQAGLEELQGMQGFGAALAAIGDNPLPRVLVVSPDDRADAARIEALAGEVSRIEGVEFVQFDLAWRQRLDAALALGTRVAWVVGILLALGALLVVGNTIRLDVAARADEITIVQLLGGTDGFVRRPFLYAGAWYGLFAGIVALAGTWMAVWVTAAAVDRLAAAYGSSQALSGPGASAHLAVLCGGIVLGWFGAWAAVGRQLAQGRPR